MPTPERSRQKSIEVCYCSPNLVQDHCDFCMAKFEIGRILEVSVPEFNDNEEAKQQEVDETFRFYKVSAKGRFNIMFALEDEEFKKC